MDAAKHILIVEDHVATREAMRDLLEATGYDVACAANGQEVLDYLRRAEPPAVILLDLSMPVMTGWQFRHEQQQDAGLAPIPVVLLSAELDLPSIAASLQAASYFTKPVEVDGLLERVRFLTEQHPPQPIAG